METVRHGLSYKRDVRGIIPFNQSVCDFMRLSPISHSTCSALVSADMDSYLTHSVMDRPIDLSYKANLKNYTFEERHQNKVNVEKAK